MKTKRKNLAFFILVMVLFAMNDLSAQTYVKTFTFRFPESSFTLEKNEGGDYILPDEAQYNWTYGEDTSKPNQTYICYQILLPDNYKIKDFTFSSDNTWFAEDVTLMPNPTVAPISTEGTGEQSSYPLVKYPAEVICTSEGLMDGYRIADFSINPFTYHADNKKLALASSLMLEITIEPIEGEKVEHTGSMTNIVQDIVINPEDFGKDTENWTPVSTGIAEECVTKTRVQTANSKLLCTSPDAVKMEVYTMDAVKVSEARFTHGQAEVKVNNTPATYLYIVTYPDGRRESGKVIVKGEG